MARERATFGVLLNWFPTADEYAGLAMYELEELRIVCGELTKG